MIKGLHEVPLFMVVCICTYSNRYDSCCRDGISTIYN